MDIVFKNKKWVLSYILPDFDTFPYLLTPYY